MKNKYNSKIWKEFRDDIMYEGKNPFNNAK
jgi:hypothetical protein